MFLIFILQDTKWQKRKKSKDRWIQLPLGACSSPLHRHKFYTSLLKGRRTVNIHSHPYISVCVCVRAATSEMWDKCWSNLATPTTKLLDHAAWFVGKYVGRFTVCLFCSSKKAVEHFRSKVWKKAEMKPWCYLAVWWGTINFSGTSADMGVKR